jgi:hypothetical protein
MIDVDIFEHMGAVVHRRSSKTYRPSPDVGSQGTMFWRPALLGGRTHDRQDRSTWKAGQQKGNCAQDMREKKIFLLLDPSSLFSHPCSLGIGRKHNHHVVEEAEYVSSMHAVHTEFVHQTKMNLPLKDSQTRA